MDFPWKAYYIHVSISLELKGYYPAAIEQMCCQNFVQKQKVFNSPGTNLRPSGYYCIGVSVPAAYLRQAFIGSSSLKQALVITYKSMTFFELMVINTHVQKKEEKKLENTHVRKRITISV